MKKIAGALAAFAAVGASTLIATPAQAAVTTGNVSIVHGIPNFVANVFVDHKAVIRNFKAYTVGGPYALPAGQHTIDIYPASNTAGTGQPALESTMTLKAGQSVSWVAHTDTSNRPTFTSYVNDLSRIPSGEARLVMRHVAVTGGVDILTNGAKAISDITYNHQASVELPAGAVTASVVRTGTTSVLAGPVKVKLAAGTETIAYGVGSQQLGTLSVVTETIAGLGSGSTAQTPADANGNPAIPSGVPAGTGGFAATQGGIPGWVWTISAGGLVVALGAGAVSLRAARTRL